MKSMNQSEKYIQDKVIYHAKQRGWLIGRFANRGYPDRIFMQKGKTFLIEFKATGKKPTKLQEFYIKKFRDNGFNVFVIDNVEDGKKAINTQ